MENNVGNSQYVLLAILRCVDVVQYGIFHVLCATAFTYPDILKLPKYSKYPYSSYTSINTKYINHILQFAALSNPEYFR